MNEKLKPFTVAPHSVKLENGKEIYLRRLAAIERITWLESIESGEEKKKDLSRALNVNALLLFLCLCDKDGSRLFKNEEIEDVKAIDEATFWFLAGEAMTINGMGKEAEVAVKKK